MKNRLNRESIEQIIRNMDIADMYISLEKASKNHHKKGLTCVCLSTITGQVGIKHVREYSHIEELSDCVVLEMWETPTNINSEKNGIPYTWDEISSQLDSVYKNQKKIL